MLTGQYRRLLEIACPPAQAAMGLFFDKLNQSALKGHGFSRAVKMERAWALAPEGILGDIPGDPGD